MTTLLVQRLSPDTPLTQELTIELSKRYHIGSLAPYLYIHNAPAGSFKFSLLRDDDSEVFSETFTSEDIKEALNTVNNYAHVFKPFIPAIKTKIEAGNYTAKLEAISGYNLTFSSFIGWVQQHEDLNNDLAYEPSNDSQNPLATRLKILKRGIE
jgi:hypothetical protein